MGETTTVDAIFGGALRLEQPARGRGYRFNVDALLLAREALLRPRVERAVDLGAGCGVAGLSVLLRGGCASLLLIERDPWVASLAARNAAAHAGAAALEADLGQLPPLPAFDLVVSNPPYTPPSGGRPSPEPRRAVARHGALGPFVQAAARLLAAGGRALFVYPAQGLPGLLRAAEQAGLGVERLRWVHPAPGAAARVALVWLVAGERGGLWVEPPWFERGSDGGEDPGLRGFLSGA